MLSRCRIIWLLPDPSLFYHQQVVSLSQSSCVNIEGVLKLCCTTFVSGSQRLRIPPVMPSTPKIVNWIPKQHFSQFKKCLY
jgi:hypothetical protein